MESIGYSEFPNHNSRLMFHWCSSSKYCLRHIPSIAIWLKNKFCVMFCRVLDRVLTKLLYRMLYWTYLLVCWLPICYAAIIVGVNPCWTPPTPLHNKYLGLHGQRMWGCSCEYKIYHQIGPCDCLLPQIAVFVSAFIPFFHILQRLLVLRFASLSTSCSAVPSTVKWKGFL